MSELKLFRLVPVAAKDDPEWSRATYHGEVVVRARSPADARIVAAAAKTDFLDIDAKPSHGVSTEFASAFRDDKLYTVIEDTSGRFPVEGERDVVAGHVRRDTVKPLQE